MKKIHTSDVVNYTWGQKESLCSGCCDVDTDRAELVSFFLKTQDYKSMTTDEFIFKLNRFLDANNDCK